MKLRLEIEIDTDEQKDLNMLEDVIEQLQDVRELLDDHQQNLNSNSRRK